MTDRIADIWGARTPFAPGTNWPARVDQYLTVDESKVQIVGVRRRMLDRINHGRLGPKGLFGWQANNAPDRLTRPLRTDGALRESDWETAIGAIVSQSRKVIAEHGPLSMAFYTSGQLFAEEYYALTVLARGGIGTPHLDGNTRPCTATAEWALVETFGSDGDPGSYATFDLCDKLS